MRLAAALAAVALSAAAQDYHTVSLSWEPVTHRDTGEPLEPGELLFYEVHAAPPDGDAAIYDVSPDRTSIDIQMLANSCFTFTAYAGATGSPYHKPDQGFIMSAPSNSVTHCTGEAVHPLNPNPPRDFK